MDLLRSRAPKPLLTSSAPAMRRKWPRGRARPPGRSDLRIPERKEGFGNGSLFAHTTRTRKAVVGKGAGNTATTRFGRNVALG